MYDERTLRLDLNIMILKLVFLKLIVQLELIIVDLAILILNVFKVLFVDDASWLFVLGQCYFVYFTLLFQMLRDGIDVPRWLENLEELLIWLLINFIFIEEVLNVGFLLVKVFELLALI